MKIHPEGAELFHAEERTDRHDKDNNFFFLILRMRLIMNQPNWYSSVLIEDYM